MKVWLRLFALGLFLASPVAIAQVIGGPVISGNTGSSSISLTTSGSSGAATLSGSVLNIPVYSGSATISLSALLASTSSNVIDNLNFANSWNWSTLTTGTALSLSAVGATSGTVLSLSETSTGAGKALSVTITGASNTGYAGYFVNSSTSGYAGYFQGAVNISGQCTGCAAVNALYYTTSSRTLLASDVNNLVSYNSSSAGSWLVPNAGGAGFTAPNNSIYISDIGTGTLVLTTTPSGGSVFNGLTGTTSASLTQNQWAYCVPDSGNNYDCVSSAGSGGSGTVSNGTAGNVGYYGATGNTLIGSGAMTIGASSAGANVEFTINSGTTQPALLLTSSALGGAAIYFNATTTTADNELGILASNFTTHPGLDFDNITNNHNLMWLQDNGSNASIMNMGASSVYGWGSGVDVAAPDTGISRKAAAVIDVGNGTQGNTAGGLVTGSLMSAGTACTVSGCSASGVTCGSSAGKFTLGANSCTAIITIGNPIATNGWACSGLDNTTSGVAIGGSLGSTTTVGLVIPSTAVSSDVITFHCMGY